ncbi:unnamed protein product [Brassica oleracea]
MCKCRSHGTFPLFGLQSSHLNICYYHQDLHRRPLRPGSRPRFCSDRRALLLIEAWLLPRRPGIGRALQRHPFSGLVDSAAHVPYWWVNNPTLGEFCFTMIGRADIEGSKSNVAMNAWLPQASYPCGNFSDTSSFKFRRSKGSIGHAFTMCRPSQTPHLTMSSARIDPPKRVLGLKEGVVTPPPIHGVIGLESSSTGSSFPADSAKPVPLAVVSLDSRQGHRIPLVRTSSELAVRRPGKAPERAVPSPSPGRHEAVRSRHVSGSSSPPTVDGGCSPWRPDAVMSTTGRERHSVLRIFKGRRECTGHHATCGALPAAGPYLRLSRFQGGQAICTDGRSARARALGFAATAAPSYSSRPGSCPDGRSFAPIPKSDERFARQYRCGPPPEFPLASPRSGIVHHLSGPDRHAHTRTLLRKSRSVGCAPARDPANQLPYALRVYSPVDSHTCQTPWSHSLTLFSKSFSSLPRGTCSLSVSRPYLALDGIYRPIGAAFPNNPTRRQRLVVRQGPGTTGLSPSLAPLSRELGPGPSLRTLLQTTIRTPKTSDFQAGLFPVRSPLLRESLLVSFPPLIDMLKLSG